MVFIELLYSTQWKVANILDTRSDCNLPQSAKTFQEELEKIIKEYVNLKDFIKDSSDLSNPSSAPGRTHGIYVEAFCNGLSAILMDFERTLAEIEESSLSDCSVSMLEIFNKLGHYIDVLPCLNYAVKEIKEEKFKGCKILDLCENLIIAYPPVLENVFRKIQQHCLKQFYGQTKLWMTQGLLDDPYCEFFIIPLEKSSSDAHSTWSTVTTSTTVSKTTNAKGHPVFHVNFENLPNMIPEELAVKIHFVGEALTVCQHNEAECKSNDRILSVCGISEQYIAAQLTEIEKCDRFSLRNFSCLIDDLWIGVNKYIRQICDEIGNVKGKLILMWEMFLLGRGELFQEFLVKGSHLWSTDVTMVGSRNLNRVFKNAVYNVYLFEYSDLTDNFYFKLPDRKTIKQGYTTWSVMKLKCKVRWPLYNLFTSDVMSTYNRLFTFLFKLKKAQIDVTSSWKDINSIKNHSLRMQLIETRMHLLAIVGNLQNYCFTNVIASEMTTLLESVNNAAMFTDLQEALQSFLVNISSRLFFCDSNILGISSFERRVDSLEFVFGKVFTLCKSFSKLNVNDENIMINLNSLKTKLESTLKSIFSFLNKIDQTCSPDGGETFSHLCNLIMCLDYNNFFLNKFEITSFE